jgi:voltage-gated potassium channel
MISVTNLVMTLLSILSIVLLSITFFLDPGSELLRLINYFDVLLCVLFLYDFVLQIYYSENRTKYLLTIGWLDFLSSIPVVSELRYIRVFRIFRMFRIIKSIRLLVNFIKKNRATSLYGFIVFCSFTVLVLGTSAVLVLEKDVGNIKTAEDAIWWSFITITTVGYGDHYPVTNLGRLIASIIIVSGVASFGAAVSYISGKANDLKDK